MSEQYRYRASFSVLSQWASGNWERAIKDYFKVDKFVTPAMVDGREMHEKWADYIKKNNALPLEFGGQKLKTTTPIVEQKRVVKLASWCDLVYIMDLYDEPTIYDWKTGKQSSEVYANSKQLPVYAMGATLDGFLVERAEIHHYDQYLKKADMSIIHITDKALEDAQNWVLTLAGEMQNYLLVNKLYERFAGSRDWGDTNGTEASE